MDIFGITSEPERINTSKFLISERIYSMSSTYSRESIYTYIYIYIRIQYICNAINDPLLDETTCKLKYTGPENILR